ncbi:MAG TPA: tetraacyldisaccharide 4'-kinase [Ramlibacter sp.]|uniref:tetraacyldisaccharide 4'-kinase n=1 Tax=Ramlibacter sp. TaxID=1917967 RepID=UPI002C61831C|nr:tetraacyldisaccharide 4'-kinase [Ramlibacter sp.]HVZ46744.1 tetraacyldisaccharide 4'-kinase [Ramlibacter sp.]
MRAALQRAWLHRGALAVLLLPLAWAYAAAVALRRAMYRLGVLRGERLARPVVVVGNVVAGGAGKTPVVMAVVEHLQARGLRAGVVSRGFGRKTTGCREVHSHADPADSGDEPLLIRRRTGVPVFVAARRAEAARALLAAYPDTQAIVSDDGLQHLALARDVEVCVFDERGTGNGWLLPAGPLRERWPRDVDLVLRPPALARLGGYAITRSLAPQGARADGTRIALEELRSKPLHAIAGIANPDAFFAMLRDAGLHPARCTPLPDHDDFEGIELAGSDTLVCTEKDAAKLWRLRPDAWSVPLEVRIDPAFWDAFDRLLDRLHDAGLSSRHGPEAA